MNVNGERSPPEHMAEFPDNDDLTMNKTMNTDPQPGGSKEASVIEENSMISCSPGVLGLLMEQAVRAAISNLNVEPKPQVSVKRSLPLSDVANQIPVFEGRRDDELTVEAWIERVEAVKTSCNLDEDTIKLLATNKLEGRARTWYLSEARLATVSWFQLRESLVAFFESEVNVVDAYDCMRARAWSNKERIEDYFLDKLRLMSRLNMSTEEKIAHLIRGVTNDVIRVQLKAAECSTVEDLLRKAKLYADVMTLPRSNAVKVENPRSVSMPRNDAVKEEIPRSVPSPQKNGLRCHGCGVLGHIRGSCPDKDKGPRCFKCNTFGHKSTECSGFTQNRRQQTVSEKTIAKGSVQKYLKKAKINGIEMDSMIDPGSAACTIRESAATRNKLSVMLQERELFGYGADEPVRCRAVAKVTIEVDEVAADEIEIIVVPDRVQSTDVMIGRTFTELPHVAFTKIGESLLFGYTDSDPFCILKKYTSQPEDIKVAVAEDVKLKVGAVNFVSLMVGEQRMTVPITNSRHEMELKRNAFVGRVDLKEKEEENRIKEKEQNQKFVSEMKQQIHEKEIQRLQELERVEEKARMQNRALIQMMNEEENKRLKKVRDQQEMREELKKANMEIARYKQIEKEEQRIAELRVQEFMRTKAEREAAREAELKLQRLAKEKEIARLRMMQERATDQQATNDEMNAIRIQEEVERMAHVDALSRAPTEDPTETIDRLYERLNVITNDDEQIMMIQRSDEKRIINILLKEESERSTDEQHLANNYLLNEGKLYRKILVRGEEARIRKETEEARILKVMEEEIMRKKAEEDKLPIEAELQAAEEERIRKKAEEKERFRIEAEQAEREKLRMEAEAEKLRKEAELRQKQQEEEARLRMEADLEKERLREEEDIPAKDMSLEVLEDTADTEMVLEEDLAIEAETEMESELPATAEVAVETDVPVEEEEEEGSDVLEINSDSDSDVEITSMTVTDNTKTASVSSLEGNGRNFTTTLHVSQIKIYRNPYESDESESEEEEKPDEKSEEEEMNDDGDEKDDPVTTIRQDDKKSTNGEMKRRVRRMPAYLQDYEMSEGGQTCRDGRM